MGRFTRSVVAAASAHMKPGSILHLSEQPSPLRVLPSSHSSPMTRPSPQSDTHAPALQLGSVWQTALQPSYGSALPSSQLSAPSFLPSPQTVGVHTLGVPSHLKPSSSVQRAEQPSPGVVLPSSQNSGSVVTPSPHSTAFEHGVPASGHEKPTSTIRQSALQPSPDTRLPSSQLSSSVSMPSPQPGGFVTPPSPPPHAFAIHKLVSPAPGSTPLPPLDEPPLEVPPSPTGRTALVPPDLVVQPSNTPHSNAPLPISAMPKLGQRETMISSSCAECFALVNRPSAHASEQRKSWSKL